LSSPPHCTLLVLLLCPLTRAPAALEEAPSLRTTAAASSAAATKAAVTVAPLQDRGHAPAVVAAYWHVATATAYHWWSLVAQLLQPVDEVHSAVATSAVATGALVLL